MILCKTFTYCSHLIIIIKTYYLRENHFYSRGNLEFKLFELPKIMSLNNHESQDFFGIFTLSCFSLMEGFSYMF